MKYEFNAKTISLLIIAALFLAAALFTKWAVIGFVVALVAALILGEKDFLKINIKTLKAGFKHLRWNLVLIVLLDVLLIVSVVGMLLISSTYLTNASSTLPMNMDLNKVLQEQDVSAVQGLVVALKGFLFKIAVAIAAVLLGSIIMYSLTKGIIWELSYSKMPDMKALIKFFLLNLFWIPVLFLLGLLLALSFRPEFASRLIIFFGVLIIHFSIVLNGVFVHKGKVWESLGKAFSLGTFKIRYFVLPYIVIALLFMALFPLSLLLVFFNPQVQAAIFLTIFMPLVMAIGRIHIAQVIKEHIK